MEPIEGWSAAEDADPSTVIGITGSTSSRDTLWAAPAPPPTPAASMRTKMVFQPMDAAPRSVFLPVPGAASPAFSYSPLLSSGSSILSPPPTTPPPPVPVDCLSPSSLYQDEMESASKKSASSPETQQQQQQQQETPRRSQPNVKAVSAYASTSPLASWDSKKTEVSITAKRAVRGISPARTRPPLRSVSPPLHSTSNTSHGTSAADGSASPATAGLVISPRNPAAPATASTFTTATPLTSSRTAFPSATAASSATAAPMVKPRAASPPPAAVPPAAATPVSSPRTASPPPSAAPTTTASPFTSPRTDSSTPTTAATASASPATASPVTSPRFGSPTTTPTASAAVPMPHKWPADPPRNTSRENPLYQYDIHRLRDSAGKEEKKNRKGLYLYRRKESAPEFSDHHWETSTLYEVAKELNLSVNPPRETGVWVSRPRKRRPWIPGQSYEEDAPNLSLVQKCSRYHVEFGTKTATTLTTDLEEDDNSTPFYTKYFVGKDHTHYVAASETLPVIASVENNKGPQRCLIRTPEGCTKTFLLPEHRREQLREVRPEFANLKFREVSSEEFSKKLLIYEQMTVVQSYKFGVLFTKAGQVTEDEFYGNEHGSKDFDQFLLFLGELITLKGWTKFKGGLDAKTDLTGTHSVYTVFRSFEIMFHVSTLLPYYPSDPQRLERKRHLGNDVVVIIWREEDCNTPFDPEVCFDEKDVFVVVQPDRTSGILKYKIAVATREGVEDYGPPLPFPGCFEPSVALREWLLAKWPGVNAERTCMYSPEFEKKLSNSRKALLYRLATEQ